MPPLRRVEQVAGVDIYLGDGTSCDKQALRGKDFCLSHLGYPAVSACYNAIGSFSRITEVAIRIANQRPNEGNSAALKEFAWRFVNIIPRALVALGRRSNYQQVRRYINDIKPLFAEYAREHLRRNGAEGWEWAVAEIAANTKERNLPAALRMPLPDSTNEMERTYITNDHWYRQRESWWQAVADPTVDVPEEDSDG